MKHASKSTIEDVSLTSTQELVNEYVMTKAWKDSLDPLTRAEVDALPDSSVTQGRHLEVVAELARRFPLDSFTGEKVNEEVPSLVPEKTPKEKAEEEKKAAEEKLAELEKQEKTDAKLKEESEKQLREEQKQKEKELHVQHK